MERKNTLSNWFIAVLIPITGLLVSWIISDSQNRNAKTIAANQQKLFALQIFSDRLTGDRIKRELTLNVIKNLNDSTLTENLTDISNRVAIEVLKDSIWSKSTTSRENAIIEYATLYKEYPKRVLDALMPRRYHLKTWEPLISITKFFYYLEIYSDSLRYGTKLDSARFATIKESKYYLHPETAANQNLPKYLEICLRNFREDKNLKYTEKGLGNLTENNKENNSMDWN